MSGNYSPAGLITDVLRILCDRKECATECLYTNAVIEALLQPIHYLLNGKEVCCISFRLGSSLMNSFLGVSLIEVYC